MLSQVHTAAATAAAPDPSSKKPPFPIENLSLERASAANFGELCDLVQMQGVEHNTTIKGDRKDFYNAVLSSNPTEKILSGIILRDKTTGKAVGYILTSKFHSPEGDGIYLEDFMMVPDMQNRGLGTFSFDILREIAEEEGCSVIACTVDASKEDSRRFYERVGMRQNPMPLMSMGSSRMSNTDQGAIVVLDKDDMKRVNPAGSLIVSEADIQAQDLRHVRIADAALDPSSVRLLTAADIDFLEEQDLSGIIHDKKAAIASLRTAHNDPLGFGIVETDGTGEVSAVMMASTTYSTFNNYARTNIGPAFSLDGQTLSAARLLNMVAFCQRQTSADRLEVQMQPKAWSQSGTQDLIGMFVSLMTESQASHETPYMIRVEDMKQSRVTAEMRSVLHPHVKQHLVAAPAANEPVARPA